MTTSKSQIFQPNEVHITMERSALAIIINHDDQLGFALVSLNADDFLVPAHRWLFKKIVEYTKETRDHLNFQLLAKYLHQNSREFERNGGMILLDQINDNLTSPKYLPRYVKDLHRTATIAKINQVINSWQQIPLTEAKEPTKILNTLYQDFHKLEQFHLNDRKKMKSLYDLIDRYASENQEFQEQTANIHCTTGLASLDEKTNGLHRGDLAILAARPSMGKTALALKTALAQIIGNTDEGSGDVIIFSLEMSWQQLVQRIITSHRSYFTQEKLSPKNPEHIKQFNESLQAHNIFIDSSMNLDVMKLHLKLMNWSLKRKIKLVIIDYLQLLKSMNTFDAQNRNLEVSFWTRHLKETARQLNIPILCLSQLSRLVERREDKRPLLSDLRDSGSIEQDADLVLFLYRESYYLSKKSAEDGGVSFSGPSEAEIIIAKQRNGPTGVIKAMFVPKETNFFELDVKNQKNE